jgi:hypothetical protein
LLESCRYRNMQYGFSITCALLIARVSSAFFLPSRAPRFRLESPATAENIDQTFILPIFPLRKAVKLPTESLKLNLYEERYLLMSEHILRQAEDKRMFGAIFCSDKAQMVKAGLGPIVPIIRSGDIGLTFFVHNVDECMVPTLGGELRRRIRLLGSGIHGFQVKRVLHSGFGDETKSLPYIMVEAVPLFDITDTQLKPAVIEFLKKDIRGVDLYQSLELRDEESIENCEENITFWNNDSVDLDLLQRFAEKASKQILPSTFRQELLSFACTSKKLDESSSLLRHQALSTTSTGDRFDPTGEKASLDVSPSVWKE